MGTTFETIYQRSLLKFKDASFLRHTDEVKGVIFKTYLLSAIADFESTCISPLTYKEFIATEDGVETIKYSFDADLTNEEQEILALGIAKHWLGYKVMDSEQLRNIIHNSDYKSFSQGAMLGELKSLYNGIMNEYDSKIKVYGFKYGGLANLKPKRGF